jgi:hypothetical protein
VCSSDLWFAGDFTPALLRTTAFEAAVKHYRAGDREPSHHHKAAREITLIASGKARIGGRDLGTGQMVLLEQNESTAFEALEDTITVVIKTPSVPGDKYLD